jgi:preprotein translocase subunit YajC
MKYLAFALAGSAILAAPAFAQATQPAAQAAPAAAANVTVGATVSDTTGGAVGTIESVSGGNAVLSTGKVKAQIPVSSFAQGPNGLIIGITKADLDAKAATPPQIAVGAAVSDPKGGAVGKVTAVAGDLVTVATAKAQVQLPKSAFAQGPSGLVIALTADQLEAAAKAAGGAAKGAGK